MRNPNYQQNLVLNLLGREIGSDYQKYGSFKYTYRHRYQLLSSVKPDFLIPIDFDACRAPNLDVPVFTQSAECLGFSPNGKYLAFHSHGSTMISVLTYTGLEGCKNTKGVVQPSTVFGKVSNVDLGGFARDHNYKNEPALGSWWSDDSSTLIVQLSMSENVDAEGVQNDEEEERLDQANNFVGDERTDPAPLMIPNEPANAQQNIPDAVRMFMNAQRDFSEVRSAHANNADQEIIKKFFRQTDRYLDSRKSEFRVAKHNETSRTIPYWVAIESAAVAAFEGEDNIHDSSVPSTSQGIRRQRAGLPYNSDESKMKQKRVKEDINSTNLSVADKLRNALAKKKKENEKEQSPEPPTAKGYLKRMHHKLREAQGISEKRIKNGSCNWPSQGSSRQNLSYSDLLRKMIRRQNSLSNVTDLEDEDGMTMVFVAYDVERGTITPLFFNDVKRKFICHMRDRTLTVTYNTDIIEIYELTKNNEWMSNKKCSTNVSIPVSLHYRPGTMPGMESRLREIETREVFNNLYDLEHFNTPLQQDVAVVLHRDMWDWVHQNSRLAVASPEITRCHMISDNLLAITMSYGEKPMIRIGVIVSVEDMTFTLYPDYHFFLKLLFVHHIHDMVPRHWTYLNPSPAIEQRWFKEGFVDVTNPSQLKNFERLNDIYKFLSNNWNNVRSTSNPLTVSPFNTVDADCFLSNYMFADGDKFSLIESSKNYKRIHMKQYYHPVDPFILVNNLSDWLIAHRQKDPDNVIVHTM